MATQQTIEAGENLFDFSRSGANTDLATGLVPYGAKDEITGLRLTIEGVNGGRDYIVDEAAAALRGTIMATATWDDITDPEALLQAARAYLDQRKLVVTSLTLTALDLSYVDKDIESFKLGEYIRVISRAHGMDEGFQLVELSEDMLNPSNSFITLGKEIKSLTSLDVAGDNGGQRSIRRAVSAVKREYQAANQQTAALIGTRAQKIIDSSAQIYATSAELAALMERLEALENK